MADNADLGRGAAFAHAAAREAVHGAVAEHFGLVVTALEVDWRGFPVCAYVGEVASDAVVSARWVELIDELAAPAPRG